MTNQLELRPVGEEDLPLLQKLTQDPEATGEFGRFGWFDPRRWRRGWDDNGLIGPDGGTLVLFMSDDTAHEAKQATRERWSIAGWFRTR